MERRLAAILPADVVGYRVPQALDQHGPERHLRVLRQSGGFLRWERHRRHEDFAHRQVMFARAIAT